MLNPFGCEIEDIAEKVIINPFLSIKKIADNFDDIEKKFEGFYFYKGITGTKDGERLTLISTSVGPTSVGDAVLFLSVCPQIKKFIFAGSAGALKKEAKLGEVYIVDKAIQGGSFEDYLNLSGDDLEIYVSRCGSLRPRLENEGSNLVELPSIKLLSIASLAFERPENLQKLLALGIEGLDLETAAFYAACKKVDIPGVAFVFISDLPLKQPLFEGLVKKDQKLMPHIIDNFQKLILNA